MNKTAIIIPARWGSTRLPQKPLKEISGKTLLQRTVLTAKKAQKLSFLPFDIIVSTDAQAIIEHCKELEVKAVLTSDQCVNGTERVWETSKLLNHPYDQMINLQGDAPFVPPALLVNLLQTLHQNSQIDIITPVQTLSWPELDSLRKSKLSSAFSGTCAITNAQGKAIWFSKQIIPSIRKEELLRSKNAFSPVQKHVGLYGYQRDSLKKIQQLPQGHYELIEELEQLRWIEAGLHVHTIEASLSSMMECLGIDSLQDIDLAQKWIHQCGDPHL